eukprot:SAG31_NODE_2258_length_6069_cov_21.781072_6_plen_121_part_00
MIYAAASMVFHRLRQKSAPSDPGNVLLTHSVLARRRHIIVVTMEDEPFVMKISDEPLAYEGFCVDMLNEMARLGNFTYSFVPVTAEQQDNGWAGAVNDVANVRSEPAGASAMFHAIPSLV